MYSIVFRCRNIQHVQSCLSKITSVREKDLDLAQKYFAMLYVNEEVSEDNQIIHNIHTSNILYIILIFQLTMHVHVITASVLSYGCNF